MQRMHAAMAMQRVEIDNAVRRITRSLMRTGWDEYGMGGQGMGGQGMGMAGMGMAGMGMAGMGYKKIGASMRHGGG